MKKEEKELLLKDLCARLNTKLVCSIYRNDDIDVGWRDEILSGYCEGDIWYEFYFGEDCGVGIDNVSKIKPYLLPLSSMTEEQYEEFIIVSGWDGDIEDIRRGKFSRVGDIELDYIYDTIDWFVKNHFDYRSLIPMGLAIDATGLGIYENVRNQNEK